MLQVHQSATFDILWISFLMSFSFRATAIEERHGVFIDVINPIESRIQIPTPKFLEFIKIDTFRPISPSKLNNARKKVLSAWNKLPSSIETYAFSNLAAILLVEGTVGSPSALSLTIRGKKYKRGLVLLDIRRFDEDTEKNYRRSLEKIFVKSVADNIDFRIENEQSSDYLLALLIHEFAHVATAIDNGRLNCTGIDCYIPFVEKKSFASFDWVKEKGRYQHINDEFDVWPKNELPKRSLLTRNKAENFLRAIASSNFTSIYSTSSPAEDLSEAVKSFVFDKILDRKISINYTHKGTEIEIRGNWGAQSFLKKEKYIRSYVNLIWPTMTPKNN